jgi:NTP pyrophosphatase (non-canonical NTP hydrolase)
MMTTNDFNIYQKEAVKTAIYPDALRVLYPTLGLSGEVGELCNKVKKVYRDGAELDRKDLEKELGDVLWYMAALAEDLGIDLGTVAEINLEKLKDRQERGVIGGSGDYR